MNGWTNRKYEKGSSTIASITDNKKEEFELRVACGVAMVCGQGPCTISAIVIEG